MIVRRLRGVILEGGEIEVGHFWKVRRFRGVILEGEEIEGGHFAGANICTEKIFFDAS